jgi:hypothetical protein
MSASTFGALHIGDARLSKLTDRFGSTATPSQLSSVFGANWAQALLPHQSPGDTCVYYLPSSSGASSVYQLCFDGSGKLAEKTVIGR